MENINLEYDKRSPKSIENYAKKLLGKSFREVIDNDNNGINDKNGEDYGASDVDEKKKNGKQYGLINGNQQIKQFSGHTIAMSIILVLH